MGTKLGYARVHCGPIGMWVWAVWWFGHHHGRRGIGRRLYQLLDLVVIRSWAGARIPAEVSMGERVGFVHDANGLIIHPDVVIGNDVTIYHQVTIGKMTNKVGHPVIGDGVMIGAGAKILGPVRVGNYAMVGANAVVTKDVPDGATVVGADKVKLPEPGWTRSPRR